jgi:undecaprenyl diphosphate synthase
MHKELNNAIEKTSANTGLVLTLALSYSSRREIVHAAKALGFKGAKRRAEARRY